MYMILVGRERKHKFSNMSSKQASERKEKCRLNLGCLQKVPIRQRLDLSFFCRIHEILAESLYSLHSTNGLPHLSLESWPFAKLIDCVSFHLRMRARVPATGFFGIRKRYSTKKTRTQMNLKRFRRERDSTRFLACQAVKLG